jgi:hypothetical protein
MHDLELLHFRSWFWPALLCVILSMYSADRRIADIVNRRTLIVSAVLSQGDQRNVPCSPG